MNDYQYATGMTAPQSYVSDMSVHQLDRNGGIIKTYKFVDAWPQVVGGIALGFNANDQIEEFTTTFVFTHFTTEFSGASVSVALNI